MADLITLTPQPVKVTGQGYQPMYLALDVSSYDILDLQTGVVDGPAGSTATVELWTGMQNQSDDGWITMSAAQPLVSGGISTWNKVNYSSGLLRFVRWKVTGFSGSSVTFFCRGLGRKNA